MNTGNKSLDYFALKYGTDKSSDIHNFANFYEPYVSRFKTKGIKLLEVGIGESSMPSLNMWSAYFPTATIYGVDINKYNSQNNRIKTFVVDQSHKTQLKEFMEKHGPFDIIIDDGSHYCSHQLNTLKHALNNITTNGVIIIEDLHSSLKTHAKGRNRDTPITALQTVRDLNKSLYVDIYEGKTGGHDAVSITSAIIPSRGPNV
jgi:hypothetical protein